LRNAAGEPVGIDEVHRSLTQCSRTRRYFHFAGVNLARTWSRRSKPPGFQLSTGKNNFL
jgi:hypothetical protein